MRAFSPNRLVAYNLARARRLRGWTQEQAAEALEPYLGVRWSKASWSAAERSAESDRPREFTADEIVALAKAFGVPVSWFFLPPDPADGLAVRVPGAKTVLSSGMLLDLVFGMAHSLEALQGRLAEILRDLPAEMGAERQRQFVGLVAQQAGAAVRAGLADLTALEASARDLADRIARVRQATAAHVAEDATKMILGQEAVQATPAEKRRRPRKAKGGQPR